MFSRLFSRSSASEGGGVAHKAKAAHRGEPHAPIVDEASAESGPAAEGATDGEDPESQVPVPEGGLKSEQLHPRVVGHQGVPATASILAFEPTQRVLAVASLDGRIKLFGAPGIEALLQSPLRAPCKYLEFMNHGGQLVSVTTQNDIEVWNLGKLELACSIKWEHDITAIAVLQGTTYMYLGDEVGTVSVLQYDEKSNEIVTLPYCIPAYITLGGLVRPGSSTAPSVVGILPQVNAAFSRLVIAYGNGLLVLWGLHETRVLAIRGGIEAQRKRLIEHAQNSDRPRTFTEKVADRAASLGEQFGSKYSPKAEVEDEEEEEKEICTVCWACQSGTVVAAGYVDGDIWLWAVPTLKEGGSGDHSEADLPFISGTPLRKIDLVPGKSMKMPVILLKWCASGKGGKDNKDASGQLFVYGGSDLNATQALTVLSLDEEASEKQLELPLHGPFADAVTLSRPGGTLSTPVAAILVLSSPGLLHMYDGVGIISHFFSPPAEDSVKQACLQPLPWQAPLKDVVFSQLFLVSPDSSAARVLLQLSQGKKDPLPSLAGGTKWPISGGTRSSTGSTSNDSTKERLFLLTGRKRGGIQVWDASAPSVELLCTVKAKTNKDPAPVSAVVLNEQSGLLAYGDQEGKVYLFKLSTEAQEVSCKIISNSSACSGEAVNSPAGYQCIAELHLHKAAISSIAISSDSDRLAVGDESGMISIVDPANLMLLFSGSWPGNSSGIARLKFAVPQAVKEEDPVDSSASAEPDSEQPKSSERSSTALYVVNGEATVAVLDGTTGDCLAPGPRQPESASKTLYMDLLDISTTPSVEVSTVQDPSVKLAEANQSSSYLFLCTQDWIQLVSTPSQNIGDSLREVKLEHSCCWASTFKDPSTHAFGAILLYQSGHLEIRSLPDLRIVVETTLTQCLHWQLELSYSFLATLGSAANGRITMISEERELIHLSVIAEENDLSAPDSPPRFFDKDLGAAAEAAMKYTTSLPRKKSGPKQGLLGVIKSALEQEPTLHPASELPKLFSSQPFDVPVIQPFDLSKTDSLGLDIDLEIDDILIDLDDMGVNSSPSASGEPSSNKIVLHRVTTDYSPKGKEVMSEETTRSQLFGDDGKPRQRTADEIKAAYGHAPKALDATNAAAMARDKLMERGEKLQSLNDKTEEMQAGAENFASMAEQLAKKYERRKWWEF
ncbi:hypothetical protein KC19_6G145700 [Ceratodon purpureus]|uniref:V-SNARE coiled-coil homology domain-containing protein n=1 Tax=Ceratodon purpureus TaxID=3225 RepID=A0A8T0HEJ3_CERPU|nr:hypothetical protein KC19_6G145700 [Ceratodon purpureus]